MGLRRTFRTLHPFHCWVLIVVTLRWELCSIYMDCNIVSSSELLLLDLLSLTSDGLLWNEL